jgi:hypothetical protein
MGKSNGSEMADRRGDWLQPLHRRCAVIPQG